ncbi:hypothetical protein OsI_02030 [Oryza sativa Indica Group]|uniref:Uncharacterized protein n=1 Tax=Oryza sativa subsp. indica TaxID=39946 RepID=A2WQA2_ORYSI|nr:hypothetical protein OsI_02030 [Oryza sativa Indica Group]
MASTSSLTTARSTTTTTSPIASMTPMDLRCRCPCPGASPMASPCCRTRSRARTGSTSLGAVAHRHVELREGVGHGGDEAGACAEVQGHNDAEEGVVGKGRRHALPLDEEVGGRLVS